jgi:hypothetical protein
VNASHPGQADFLADLTPVGAFVEALDASQYAALPQDWVVFLTDVRDSTGAIARGGYRSVNLVGAACIVAAINAAGRRPAEATPRDARSDRIGWAFGGDGATLVVHAQDADAVEQALVAVAAMAEGAHGLSLRVGRVPASALTAAGLSVGVCRLRLAGTDTLTMLRGDGIAAAEAWIKAPDSRFLVDTDRIVPPADLGGLSCNWEPFAARRGVVLALLVLARGEHAEATYRDVYRVIDQLAADADAAPQPASTPDGPHGHPVPLQALRKDVWAPSTLGLTRATRGFGRSWIVRLRTAVAVWLDGVLGNAMFRLGLRSLTVKPATYLPSTVARTDFRKFDGMLRMVVELPEARARALEAWLAHAHAAGRLCYGVHASGAAVMTCAVFSFAADSHVHFVDGADGGYAMAASRLKQQIAEG